MVVFAARGCQGVSLPPVEARNKGFRPFEVSRRVRRARQPDIFLAGRRPDSSTETYLGRPEGSPSGRSCGPAGGWSGLAGWVHFPTYMYLAPLRRDAMSLYIRVLVCPCLCTLRVAGH